MVRRKQGKGRKRWESDMENEGVGFGLELGVRSECAPQRAMQGKGRDERDGRRLGFQSKKPSTADDDRNSRYLFQFRKF